MNDLKHEKMILRTDGSADWPAMKRQSAQSLRRRTIAHINARTTDLAAEGPMPIDPGIYTDPERFLTESQVLFRESPILACLSGDLPEPGDTFLFDELGPALLLVRNQEGRVNAFLNMCTHRCARVVNACSRRRRLTCRFHGWTFDLDGRLVAIPGAEGFEGIRKEDRNLVPVPVVEWHGLVFVRAVPNGEPIDIMAHLGADFALELAHLELARARPMKSSQIPVRSNWKYALDTYGEGYHFATLHPSTIGALAFSNIMTYDNYGPHHRLAMPRAEFLDYADKPEEEWPETSYCGLYFIFPNVVINVNTMKDGQQFYGISRLFPGEQVDRGNTLLTTYMPGHVSADVDPTPWQDMHDFIHKVVETEDYSVSEEGQRNMRFAPQGFQPVLGANELALQNLHRHINARVEAARKA